MTSSHGKKFILISQEEYERLKIRQNQNVFNPTKQELFQREKQLKEVLDESEIPDDEKIRLFTENLNYMKKQYDKLIKPKPIKVIMDQNKHNESIKKDEEKENSIEEEEYSLEKSLIKSLPKSSQNGAQLILDHLKNYPRIIKWNEFGELIYKDEIIKSSNLTDLISNVLSMKKSTASPPLLHETIFLKALSEKNAPETWIKNKSKKKIIQSYKSLKAENPFSSPMQSKKTKINWSSST